jgi:hypothetical protein
VLQGGPRLCFAQALQTFEIDQGSKGKDTYNFTFQINFAKSMKYSRKRALFGSSEVKSAVKKFN